jgi:hypothetical protein
MVISTVFDLDVLLEPWDDLIAECIDLLIVGGNNLLVGSSFVIEGGLDGVAAGCEFGSEFAEQVEDAAYVLLVGEASMSRLWNTVAGSSG